MWINASSTNDAKGGDQPEFRPQETNGQAGTGEFASDAFDLISEHRGKLAMGAAAALGLMILYHWREKSLAEEDPEAYARLKKFTAPFKPADEIEQEEFERKMREQGGLTPP